MSVGGNNTATGIASGNDVALNNPASGQALTYDSSIQKWKNTPVVTAVTYDSLPAGATLTVARVAGNWPARPTARTDIIVQWKGPDPSPPIVSSGTGGMLDNVDIRLITS